MLSFHAQLVPLSSLDVSVPGLQKKGDLARKEHVALSCSSRRNETVLEVGHQVRIERGDGQKGNAALFTIKDFVADRDDNGVKDESHSLVLPDEAIQRLGLALPYSCKLSISTKLLDNRFTEEDAKEQCDLCEKVLDDGGSDIVIIAPHGGDTEPKTDQQAEETFLRLREQSDLKPAMWALKGYFLPRDKRTTKNPWHITSADISENSFDGLKKLMQRGQFKYAVAYHGMHAEEGREDIRIGGNAPKDLKRKIKHRLRDVLKGLKHVEDASMKSADGECRCDFVIKIAKKSGGLGGTSPANIVNRMGVEGVQLEQTPPAREQWKLIARTVADVYREVIEEHSAKKAKTNGC